MIPLQMPVWKDDTVRSLQEKFTDLFPGLQIRLFRHSDGKWQGDWQDVLLCPDMKMYQINPLFRDGLVQISGYLTVSQLENIFLQEFGLFVQVFRKNGSQVNVYSEISNYLLENKMMQA